MKKFLGIILSVLMTIVCSVSLFGCNKLEINAVESATYDANKDQLVVATNAAFAPFEYKMGNKFAGIDMEIAALLAQELG